MDQKTRIILATDFAIGSQHDFQLFKESRSGLASHLLSLADTGYLGIHQLHANSQIPAKKSKLHPLTPAQKEGNRQLSCQRIFVENVIARIKVFRILSERYRNRRKRFSLRFNLIAAIYNLEIAWEHSKVIRNEAG